MRRSTDALGGGVCARQPKMAMAASEQRRTSRVRNKLTAFRAGDVHFHYRRLRRSGRTRGPVSVDQLRAIDIAGCAQAREGQVEAFVVLIALRAQGEAAVFECQAAAAPVVAGLHASV